MAGSRSRSRSRSPDRGADAPPADASGAPPADDAGAPPPQADNGAGGGGDDGEGVKLYIGNLDYCESALEYRRRDRGAEGVLERPGPRHFFNRSFSHLGTTHFTPSAFNTQHINPETDPHATPRNEIPRRTAGINIRTYAATDEPQLRSVFGAFGTVTDVFLPMERGTSRPRGFGFVTLSTRQAAEDAIAKMDQSQLDGRTIRVNESRPRGEGPGARRSNEPGTGPGGYGAFNPSGREEVKLYVGNLSFDTNEEAVRGMFEQYGTVSDCFLPSDRDTGRPRGFAFVTMPAKEAETACNKINGMELDGRTVRVNEAQPKVSRGAGGGSKSDPPLDV